MSKTESAPPRKVPTLAEWWQSLAPSSRGRVKFFGGAVALLVIAFALPLYALGRFVWKSDVQSHIMLIPFITLYLVGIRRERLAWDYVPARGWVVSLAAVGIAALAMRWQSGPYNKADGLSLYTLAFVFFILASAFGVFGRRFMASIAFPAAFVLFMVPLPDLVVDRLETASKLASAEVAHWMFDLTATPNIRDGEIFQLPTITIRVAQECSGIRSSLVLFITGILAAEMFLKSAWRRALLVFLVIPLGIVRNGFRILVIGMLCVHVGPHMIDSPIHHRGGPVFFVLSVGVLLVALWWLRRSEQREIAEEQEAQFAPDSAKNAE